MQIKVYKNPESFGKEVFSYIAIEKKFKTPKNLTPANEMKISENNSYRISLN